MVDVSSTSSSQYDSTLLLEHWLWFRSRHMPWLTASTIPQNFGPLSIHWQPSHQQSLIS